MPLRRTKNRSLPDLAGADALDLNWHPIYLLNKRRDPSVVGDRYVPAGIAEFPQLEKLLTHQLVVVIAAIVIATPVSAASAAAGDTCVRHRRQWSTNSSLRGTDAEHHSIRILVGQRPASLRLPSGASRP